MPNPRSGYAHPYFPRGDVERRWLFRLEFTFPGINNMDILSINAMNVTVPSYNLDPIVIPHLNMDVKVTGRPTLDVMSVTFQTAYNLDAITVLETWHSRVYRASVEMIGLSEDYKADCDLIVLRPGNNNTITDWKIYNILGVWPSDIGAREYDWSASENTTRTVTFQVDKVLPPGDQTSITSGNIIPPALSATVNI